MDGVGDTRRLEKGKGKMLHRPSVSQGRTIEQGLACENPKTRKNTQIPEQKERSPK